MSCGAQIVLVGLEGFEKQERYEEQDHFTPVDWAIFMMSLAMLAAWVVLLFQQSPTNISSCQSVR